MQEYVNHFAIYFITLFFCIDVLGLSPIFISMTCHLPLEKQRAVVNKGVSISLAILLVFALFGLSVLHIFGISLEAFKVAGGILLLLLAIEMVLGGKNAQDNSYKDDSEDIAIFPIALPLLSGPATISMLIVFMKQAEGNFFSQFLVILALLLNMVVSWFVLRYANVITKRLGASGINILTKIFGILMSALACQFIINGIGEAYKLF